MLCRGLSLRGKNMPLCGSACPRRSCVTRTHLLAWFIFNTENTDDSELPSGTFGWIRIIALRWADRTENTFRFSILPQADGSLISKNAPPPPHRRCVTLMSLRLCVQKKILRDTHPLLAWFIFNTENTDDSELPSGTP